MKYSPSNGIKDIKRLRILLACQAKKTNPSKIGFSNKRAKSFGINRCTWMRYYYMYKNINLFEEICLLRDELSRENKIDYNCKYYINLKKTNVFCPRQSMPWKNKHNLYRQNNIRRLHLLLACRAKMLNPKKIGISNERAKSFGLSQRTWRRYYSEFKENDFKNLDKEIDSLWKQLSEENKIDENCEFYINLKNASQYKK